MRTQVKRILLISLAALLGCQAGAAAAVPEGARFTEYHEPIPDGYTPLTGRSETFNPITAQAFVKTVRFGVNAGNTLDATGRKGLETEISWGNAKLTLPFFMALKAKGLDVVRIPISWEPHIVDFTDTYAIDPLFMDRVQSVVEYALDAGLYVIIDTHHEENHLLPRISNDDTEGAIAEVEAVWRQIAERFKGYGERLIFNLLNEPRNFEMPGEWSGGTDASRDLVSLLNTKALAAVRSSGGHNDKRLVMMTPHAASFRYARHLDVPDDPYVLVSIHAYEPYEFALNRTGTDQLPERNNIGEVFATLNNTFIKKGIPVIMDETGALNKRGNLDERVKWAEAFAEYSKKFDIPVVLWDNGITDVSTGESFGLIDRYTLEWIFPRIIDAFLE